MLLISVLVVLCETVQFVPIAKEDWTKERLSSVSDHARLRSGSILMHGPCLMGAYSSDLWVISWRFCVVRQWASMLNSLSIDKLPSS